MTNSWPCSEHEQTHGRIDPDCLACMNALRTEIQEREGMLQ